MSLKPSCNNYIQIKNKVRKKIVDSPKQADYLIYKNSLNLSNYIGRKVKIAILDSGCPQHKDIKIRGERVNFCDNTNNIYDTLGHSTMVSGLINSYNKDKIIGICPSANVSYVKIIDDSGYCSFNSIIAAVLWSIVKEIDIIIMAIGTDYDYMVLRDALKKAHNENICIFAAAGDGLQNKKKEIDFPAKYDEVFSVGCLTKLPYQNKIIKTKIDAVLPNTQFDTTYLDNKYVSASGSSLATAIVGGLAALLVEKYKKESNINDLPKKIYKDLKENF